MFGLTFEKLFLVIVVAGVVIGPQRLPLYAHRLTQTVRSLRALVESARGRAEADLGVSLARVDLDARRYDPVRIVREALADRPDAPASGAEAAATSTEWPAEVWAEAERIRPGQRYLTSGSAAHPRRVLIDSLPEGDPRKLAAHSTGASPT